jgi:hypothetical protein
LSIFEQVKAAITLKQAAEYYGVKAGKGNMACCPFHNDRHPSLKLNEDYFFCFGCGEHGDVIDFTAKLFGLGSYEAAKKLEADFGTHPTTPMAAIPPRRPLLTQQRKDETLCVNVLTEYEDLLKRWKVEYAPRDAEEPWDDRFVEACQMLDYVTYLADYLIAAELEDRVKTVDQLMRNGIVPDLKKRLDRLREEERHGHKREYEIAC